MKELLLKLTRHQTLSQPEAYEALARLSQPAIETAQVAAFMTVFMMRPVTLDELSGFRAALLDLCLHVDLRDFDPIDLCGTGGDGKDTFNISTLAAFVTAACGVPVAKHGNYGVSSVSGSSNVLEHLGIAFTHEEDRLKRMLEQAGICFMHAPLFHPAMKQVAPVRKALGVRTFFNLLGPVVNPAKVQKQLTGVFNLELARLYHYLFQQSGVRYAVVHCLEGYDEISLTGSFRYLAHNQEKVYAPQHFGTRTLAQHELYGGSSVAEAARIFTEVLQQKSPSARSQVVCANAAAAVSLYRNIDLQTAFAQAEEALFSGRALQSFHKLRDLS